MKVTKIPKGKGKFRTIYSPERADKIAMQMLLPPLNAAAIAADRHNVAHAFMPGRSIVTNALAHAGDWQITLSFDFTDFFDSVTPEMVTWHPPHGTNPACMPDLSYSTWSGLKWIDHGDLGVKSRLFPDGAARQGLPTSPALANLAAAKFDSAVIALRDRLTPTRRLHGKKNIPFVYTRYADDLTFSTNSEKIASQLLTDIPQLAQEHGFHINPEKTTRQHARAGHRIVTGIAATPTGVVPTRSARRKLRAASHQIEKGIRRRNLRKMLSKQTESFMRGDPYTHHRLGDILRAQWRGLAGFVRLILPKHRTDLTAATAATSTYAAAHKSTPEIPMPFGIFNRRITT